LISLPLAKALRSAENLLAKWNALAIEKYTQHDNHIASFPLKWI